MLIVPNRKIKKAANIILLVAKLLNLYSHFAIDDQFERMAPTLVFFFMLVCRMVVDWQFVNNVPPPQVDKLNISGIKVLSWNISILAGCGGCCSGQLRQGQHQTVTTEAGKG